MRVSCLSSAVALLCLVLVACVCSVATATPMLLHSMAVNPLGAKWVALHPAPMDSLHTLTFNVHPNNLTLFYERLHNLSDPSHPHYGQWMTPSDIHNMTGLTESQLGAFQQWLQAHNISSQHGDAVRYTEGTNALHVMTTVGKAQLLLNTTFHVYNHSALSSNGTGRVIIRQSPMSHSFMPDSVHGLVWSALGMGDTPDDMEHFATLLDGSRWSAPAARPANVGPSHPRHRFATKSTSYYDMYAPAVLDAYYGLPDRSGFVRSQGWSTSNSVGVWEPYGQFYSPTDLQAFSYLQTQTQSRTALPSPTAMGSANSPAAPTMEATLDVQALLALQPEANAVFFLDTPTWNGWLGATNYLLSFSDAQLPKVLSFSYGSTESASQSAAFAAASYNFAVMGARGITVLVSSGDSGANGGGNPQCIYNQPNTYPSYLYASYPATSPFVTAVGATTFTGSAGQMVTNSKLCSLTPAVASAAGVTVSGYGSSYDFVCPTSQANETAVDWYGSGGGFSRLFSQPSYQSAAVQSYLTSGTAMPPAAYYSASGRAIPDVSMYGSGFPIVLKGQLSFVGGTSLSAPAFAAVVSMMNEVSLQCRGTTVGFVNPLLYQMQQQAPAAFHDIRLGNNANCPCLGSSPCACAQSNSCQGYKTAKGWDAVTGLGSPNWPAMQSYLTNLWCSASRPRPPTAAFLYNGASGTYTTPSNPQPLYLRVRLVGAGGGGGGPSTGTAGMSGIAGGTAHFGPFTAGGGGGGLFSSNGNAGGAGGLVSVTAYSGYYLAFNGEAGEGGSWFNSQQASASITGGLGGSSQFGGGGASAYGSTHGAGFGAGGAGGCAGEHSGVSFVESGAGGGAGGYVEAIIWNPAASYSWAAPLGGAGGTNTQLGVYACSGTAGGSAFIAVEAHYQ